mgnify:CR=1|jgi:hypothetical protein
MMVRREIVRKRVPRDAYLAGRDQAVHVALCFTRLRKKPRLPILRSSLLRRMDQAVGLQKRFSTWGMNADLPVCF